MPKDLPESAIIAHRLFMPVNDNTPATTAEALRKDIAIIGAGFAGSLMALMLARHGYAPVVIDLHEICPPDFRCEKFNDEQVGLMRDLGVLDTIMGNADPARTGLSYAGMVGRLRAAWPEPVRFLTAKVTAIDNSALEQRFTLQDGRVIVCRLAILATGTAERLRHSLGLFKYILSAQHSVSIGFALKTRDGLPFAGHGMVCYGEKAGDGVGHAGLFSLSDAPTDRIRVNLFLYEARNSERVRAFRRDPVNALFAALPRLKARLPAVHVDGPVEVRVTELYDITQPQIPGVILIGDARRTSCPATGSGLTRILHDVRDLCLVHVSSWLESPALSPLKLAAFYEDEQRIRRDAVTHRQAMDQRALALNTGLLWRLRRWWRDISIGQTTGL